MDGFVKVARVGELAQGGMVQVDVHGQQVLLANVGGQYYAVAGECTHAGGLLADGMLDGDVVECPLHGGRFSLRTGQAVQRPPRQSVAVYQVRVGGGDILVGPPAL